LGRSHQPRFNWRETNIPRGLLLARKAGRQTMRFVHISVIVAFVAVILIFALQNHESVNPSSASGLARRSLSSLLFFTC
jgi:hypothetical protein